MARIASDFDWSKTNTRRSRYDWDTLLDGNTRVLTRGEDFDAKVTSMASTVAVAAKRKGIKVRTATLDENEIVIQALGKDDEAAPEAE